MQDLNLVIQTAFLGDLILSVPMLLRIKKNFPDNRLAVVCKKGLGEFLLKDKIVDVVFEVEKSNRHSYKAVLTLLKNERVRNLYCVHRSPRSVLFSSQIFADKKIGFGSFLGFWTFDDLVHFDSNLPEVLRQFKILESTDHEVKAHFLNDDLIKLHEMREPIPEFFSFPERKQPTMKTGRVALFPGSVWATKRWTVEGFRKLCELLRTASYEVDLLGAADEKSLCDRIAEGLDVNVRAGEFSIAGSIENITQYDVVVANDSAPTHMAAYKGVPVVTVFGPTTSAMGFRPWRENAAVIEVEQLKCRPCGRHGHERCPLSHHRCMTEISADRVYSAVRRLMQTP